VESISLFDVGGLDDRVFDVDIAIAEMSDDIRWVIGVAVVGHGSQLSVSAREEILPDGYDIEGIIEFMALLVR
jgi:hypothetical protein